MGRSFVFWEQAVTAAGARGLELPEDGLRPACRSLGRRSVHPRVRSLQDRSWTPRLKACERPALRDLSAKTACPGGVCQGPVRGRECWKVKGGSNEKQGKAGLDAESQRRVGRCSVYTSSLDSLSFIYL